MTAPTPRPSPACLGVGCQHHADCVRYWAVENSPHDQKRIGTCDKSGTGARPLFVQREGVKA